MKNEANKKMDSVEQAILDAKQKKIVPEELLPIILKADFYLVCDSNMLNDKDVMLPLCVEIESKKHVCVFTNKDWAEQYLNDSSSIVKLSAKKSLQNIPENYGLVINPNHNASIKFSSLGIENILRDFT